MLLYLLRKFLVDDGQFKSVELLALVQVFRYAQERSQRLYLAHGRQAVQVVVDRLDAVDLVGGEPGIRRIRRFFIEAAEQVVQVFKVIILSRLRFLFFPILLDRIECQDHVQGRGAAQFVIDQFQSLVYFRVIAEIIDETVLYLQPGYAVKTESSQQQCNHNYAVAVSFGRSCQRCGKRHFLFAGRRDRLVQGNQDNRKQQEGRQEGNTESQGHHPAEINHRLDIADHQ